MPPAVVSTTQTAQSQSDPVAHMLRVLLRDIDKYVAAGATQPLLSLHFARRLQSLASIEPRFHQLPLVRLLKQCVEAPDPGLAVTARLGDSVARLQASLRRALTAEDVRSGADDWIDPLPGASDDIDDGEPDSGDDLDSDDDNIIGVTSRGANPAGSQPLRRGQSASIILFSADDDASETSTYLDSDEDSDGVMNMEFGELPPFEQLAGLLLQIKEGSPDIQAAGLDGLSRFMAGDLLATEHWPQLRAVLLQLLESSNHVFRQRALTLIADLFDAAMPSTQTGDIFVMLAQHVLRHVSVACDALPTNLQVRPGRPAFQR